MTVGPLYLYFHIPATAFKARVNMASVEYPVTELTFDTVTWGAYTDIVEGMTLALGTTEGADDLGRVRVQGAATSTTIPVGRISEGYNDGELSVSDNVYISVFNEFRVWSKIPYIVDENESYKDANIPVGDRTTEPPPVANTGPGFAATVDDVTGLMTVSFDGGTSFATADGATIAGFLWDVDDGTITVGTATNAEITATFPAGFRYVSLTVTDSNGKTHTARCPVYGRDVQNDTTVEHYEITGHSIRPEGQRLNVRILEDMPRSTYPDGCLVMFWEDEPLSPSDRNHMQFIGWHQSDQVSVRATRTGNLRDTVLECVDVTGRLDTLPGFPQVVRRADTPDKWRDMYLPTMDRFIHYVLHWHSTALELADYFPSDTGDDYPFVEFQSNGESLYQQADNEAKALVPDHRFTCNRRGQLAIVADPMLQDMADRTSTVQGTFTEEYTQDIRFNYTRPPRIHWIRGNAMLTATDYADVDGVDTLYTLHNIAPGTAPGQGVSELTTNEQLARSQADLNAVTGHRYARLNSRYGLVTVTPPDSANYTHIDPATMDWVNLTVTADTAAQRGLTFTNTRTQCKEINVRYSDNGTGLVRTMTFTLEIETSGLPAETVIPPGTPPAPESPTIPAPDFGLVEGQQQVAAVNLDGYIYRTSDFQTLSGAGGPTWDRVDTGITETIYSFVVDPFSPGYIDGAGAINGWVATEDAIYRVADLFGSVIVTEVHTFGTTAAASSYHWRSIQASFGTYFAEGANPWLLCISYYGSTSGKEGTWATYSIDGGATWATEVQVSEFYDNGTPARFNPIGVYTSPKTSGLAYTAAYKETASPAQADGYMSTDWGETWTRLGEDVADSPTQVEWWSWPDWNVGGTSPQFSHLGGSARIYANVYSPGGLVTDEIAEMMVFVPPANTKRVLFSGNWEAYIDSEAPLGSVSVDVGLEASTTSAYTVTETFTFVAPPRNGGTGDDFTLEVLFNDYATQDWTVNRDNAATAVASNLGAAPRMRVSLEATGVTSNYLAAVAFIDLHVVEMEFDDGTIYTSPAASGLIQPGHAQAGSIHLPWPDNATEQLAYYGYTDFASTREFHLHQSASGTITDISPMVTGTSYGVNRYGFSVRTHDNNRQYLLLAGIGNGRTANASDDKHGVFVSDDYGATWSTVVTPIADSAGLAGRPAFEAAFGGSDPGVIFVWGPADQIGYSGNFGASVDVKTGNLATLNGGTLPEPFIGIAGGPTGA